MKQHIWGAMTFCLLASFSAQALAQGKARETYSAAVWEAIDRRDAADSALATLEQGARHVAFGMIGGDDACEQIKADMRKMAVADAVSAASLALCGRDTDRGFLADVLGQKPADWRSYRAVAPRLGLVGGKDMQRFMVDLLNRSLALSENLGFKSQSAGLSLILEGLMQSLVYDRLNISDLPGLPAAKVLQLTQLGQTSGGVDFAAAYLLGRLRGLEAQISAADLLAAIAAVPGTKKSQSRARVVAALLGSLARYKNVGPAVAEYALQAAASDHPMVQVAAIRLMASLPDGADVEAYLQDVLADTETYAGLRVAALQALTRRNADGLGALLAAHLADTSVWVRKAALDALVDIDEALAESAAAEWLDGELYLANAAISVLAGSETGKVVLSEWAGKHAATVRGKRITARLKADTELRDVAKTDAYAIATTAAGQSVVLQTSRGAIHIQMNANTPFAARNFVKLVNRGLMDDGLFHRVIPNFVAQWGESEKPEIAAWPMVRDNWLSGAHVFGSVGVATAGKDTGAAQFFINTHDNLHLTGRYTVVGYVTKGMDVALQLAEGDKLLSAQVSAD